MAAGKKAARVGVAAFALGLSLAGPHTGVATADTDDDGMSSSTAESSASSASAPTQGARAHRSKARGSAASRVGADRGSTRADVPAPAAARGPRAAAAIPGPARRAASQTNDSQPALPAVSVPEASTPGLSEAAGTGGSGTQPDTTGSVLLPSVPDTAPSESLAGPATRALPSWAAATVAAPKLPAAAVMANPVGSINTAVQNFFNGVSDWLENLPANQITTFLEGALLLVRRNFFNHVAIASPVQTSYDPEDLSADIIGSVGAEDPEGEALTYTVVQNPQRGEVTVDADGQYVYAPGEGFAGQDSFVVKVTSAGGGVNLLDLGAGRSTTVTILVGENAPTSPFTSSRNIRDVALFLGGVPVLLSVGKANMLTGRQTASISLRASDDSLVTWLDDQGNAGTISVAEVGEQWAGFQSAGNIRLGVTFALEDYSDAAVILTSVKGSYLPDSGLYVFSGELAADPVNGEGVDSHYDIVGASFDSAYDNFRAAYLDVPKFGGVDLFIDSADLFADSYSLRDYKEELAGTDPGVSLVSVQAPQVAAGLTASASTAAGVTSMLAYGGGAVVGRGTGEVRLWNGSGWIDLANFGSGVTSMMSYRDGFVVGLTNGSVKQWSPIWVNDVTDGLAASAFTAFATNPTKNLTPDAEGAAKAFDNSADTKYLNFAGAGSGVTIDLGIAALVNGLGLTAANDVEDRDPTSYQIYGSSDGATFTLISEGALTPPATRKTDYVCSAGCDGSRTVVFGNDTAYRYYRVVFPTVRGDEGGIGCATGCMQIAEIRLPGAKPGWTELQDTAWGQPVNTMMPYGDGFVVGLGGSDKGGVWQWTGAEFKRLHDAGWAQPVSALMPYGDGFVVGLGGTDKGGVFQFTGTTTTGGQNTWKTLHDAGWAQPVSALMPYGDGFVVGLGGTDKGGVFQFTGTTTTGGQNTWKTLHGTGWAQPVKTMIRYGDGFAVGLGADGRGGVWQWTGTATTGSEKENWAALQDTGWKQSVSTMVPFENGFVVGLGGSGKGAIEYWGNQTRDDVTDILGTSFASVPRDSIAGQPISPKGEGVYEAFDNSVKSKYLNTRAFSNNQAPGAIVYLPEAYAVQGLALYTGSDSADYQQRDPVAYELFGWDRSAAKYIPVASGDLTLPAKGTVAYPPVEFVNSTAYERYMLIFPKLRGSDQCGSEAGTSCMQIAEIELPGVAAKPSWKELHNAGWASAVTTMIPYRDGFLVGLANGSVQQWTGDDAGAWQELSSSRIPLTGDSLLEAITFVQGGGSVLNGENPGIDDFAPGSLFGKNPDLLPRCVAAKNCDGSLYPLTYNKNPAPLSYGKDDQGKPKELKWTQSLGQDKQSLAISYDLGYSASGYVYVPNGLWAKLKPANYSAGMLATLTTGPSATLTLGKGDVPDFDTGRIEIANGTLLYEPTAIGIFDVKGKLEGQLTGKLALQEGFTKDKLVATAYYNAGVLSTLNTVGGNGIRFGFASKGPLATAQWDDFKAIQGVVITPTLIPTITLGYGLFINDIPIVGDLSLIKLSLGYENPVGLELGLYTAAGIPAGEKQYSVKLVSEGSLLYGVGILPELTKKLTFEDSLKLYGPERVTIWEYSPAETEV